MSTVAAAHDLLVNTDMGDMKQPDWMVRVKEDYFKADESMFASRELGELLDEMDTQGRRACGAVDQPRQAVGAGAGFVDARPERFSLGIGGHDLLRPMPNLRNLESFVARPPGRVHDRRPELLGRRHVPAQRRGVLPALHEVLRARPADVHQHRSARAADPG